jgi:CRISPR/Cas system-associated exonuclease Cas4 (RecB family)
VIGVSATHGLVSCHSERSEEMMSSEEHAPCKGTSERDEMELIAEINELASQFDSSEAKLDWKKSKVRGIIDMIKAKFSSLHLHYNFEVMELKGQIRNRNQHIHQLELALQEILEKYRELLEAQGILSLGFRLICLRLRRSSTDQKP